MMMYFPKRTLASNLTISPGSNKTVPSRYFMRKAQLAALTKESLNTPQLFVCFLTKTKNRPSAGACAAHN